MAAKNNEKPPKMETGFLCIFNSSPSGKSKTFLFWEKNISNGTEAAEIKNDIPVIKL